MRTWTFFSNHSHVLFYIAGHPDARMREIADAVGITERAAQRIVAELEAEGYLVAEKVGRRNRYAINPEKALRHPVEQHRTVGDLLRVLTAP